MMASLSSRHSGQAGDSWREPESRDFREVWIPASAGMTKWSDDNSLKLCSYILLDGFEITAAGGQKFWSFLGNQDILFEMNRALVRSHFGF
jgi:hypothetical protein